MMAALSASVELSGNKEPQEFRTAIQEKVIFK